MVKNWAPQKNPTRWSKARWTADITELKRIYTSAARRVKSDGSGVEERNEAKKAYKAAIDKAKRKHWNNVLASATKNDVWTAHQFTKQIQSVRIPGGHNDSPDQTSQKIMEHFFPPSDDPISPRPLLRKELVDGDRVTAGEVSETLEKCSNKSAPGPDQVLYGIWNNIHRMEGKIIPKVVEDMLEWGIHPPMLKESAGIILRKPGKKDYTDCASFRVMAVMQTFSKIVERIVNKRLMAIADKEDRYCINQTGSLPQRSTVDATLLLKHWIRESQFAGKKTSTVCLDVKGVFDNVNHSKLLDQLGTEEKVPRYLVDWISNFIHTRQIALAYPGSPRTSNKVDRGIPQGSPLSPLLFVIYVRALHPKVEDSDIFTSSYVDDFQITVASTSWYRNTKILEERIQRMKSTAAGLGLSFSIAKTKLKHWRKPKEKGERSECTVMFQSHVIEPAGKAVKWLRFWHTDNGEKSTHFGKRLALAQAAFIRIQRLSMPGKGVSPYGARRLAKGIILPTLLNGAKIFDLTVTMIGKMQRFWNRVLRWITNSFYATNTTVISVEACLALIKLYAKQGREMTAVRITTAVRKNNRATAMLPGGYPLVEEYRYPTNRRQAFDNNKGGMRPEMWNSTATTTAEVHLPIHEVGAIAAGNYSARPLPNETKPTPDGNGTGNEILV